MNLMRMLLSQFAKIVAPIQKKGKSKLQVQFLRLDTQLIKLDNVKRNGSSFSLKHKSIHQGQRQMYKGILHLAVLIKNLRTSKLDQKN
ncbi:hypothetical protein FGO68_gene7806 [Halteria grandinella]|uniref:Uncharacterized protein n=1 Tax=Halteria grandinella TaxID=5974 RepID=A0A8J8NKB1_HALGN|nr:hypothetical protein FGO68_gene7806 [Halteria grandinella]